MRLISEIDGVEAPIFKSPHFKEFTVNFDDAGINVKEVHKKLLQHKIHGGKDISKDFPELGETALYCVTEVHSKGEIERLAEVLKEVLAGR
jgi:glycine dehydrogenase subunit 1